MTKSAGCGHTEAPCTYNEIGVACAAGLTRAPAILRGVVVRGPSLTLRYARPDDADALFEMGRDADVTRFFSWGPYQAPAEAHTYIDSLAPQRDAGARLEFVVTGADDRPVGVTGLSEFSLRDRRAVVGTWFGREHWGTGVNRESKALVLALGFRRLGLNRITAWANPDNGRSNAALEKLGFRNEGTLRAWHVHGGEPRDCGVLAMLSEEFEASELGAMPVSFEGDPPPQFLPGA